MKHYEQFLPNLMIVLNLLASAGYASKGDVKRATYWLAAAVIIWSVK